LIIFAWCERFKKDVKLVDLLDYPPCVSLEYRCSGFEADLQADNIWVVRKNFARKHMLSGSKLQTIASDEEFGAFQAE
jgi:hypothetical protein